MTVSIRGVSFRYPGAETFALRDLTLDVAQGEFVALIGPNGCGKTTLCKMLTGIVPQFIEGDFEGEVLVSGRNALQTRLGDLSRLVGYVYQDFENQLLKPKVRDDVAFGPLNFGMADYEERATRTLTMLGLVEIEDRIIWELSGGQQHLVALAGAVALEPDIIVVDEPVSQLDPVNADTVYARLAHLNQLGKTIISIEHHPEYIGAYCDSVVLMKDGQVLWKLPTREALARVDELAQYDIFAPQVTRIAHQVGIRLARPGADYPIQLERAVDYFRPMLPAVIAGGGEVQAVPEPDAAKREAVVVFEGVTHRYLTITEQEMVVLDDVNVTFREGERVALVGANGAGKSTLLKCVAGLVRPRQGRVWVMGRDALKTSPEDLADVVSLVYQDPQQMFIDESIRHDVAYFLKARKHPETEALVTQALADFNLTALADRDGRLLSGGQMRRASLAIGACMRPRVMLLDEPTASLDVNSRLQIMQMLTKLDDWVKTVVVASHDMELVAEWATRVIVMHNGRIVADAPPIEIFKQMALAETAKIRPPQVVRLCHALGLTPVHLTVEQFADYVVDYLSSAEGRPV